MPFTFAPALFDGFSFDSIRTPFVPHALPPATLVLTATSSFLAHEIFFTLPRLSGIRNSGVVSSVFTGSFKGLQFKSLSASRVLNPAPLPFVFQFSNSISPCLCLITTRNWNFVSFRFVKCCFPLRLNLKSIFLEKRK